ncbi:hypothetical protein U1769_14625 [Sphingomonas sp. ZT3P38]|uniref:hypothetical protein n=1 Tax=Parasphingomonas zepuensis TaxID=3096161 RepID=UPI002FC70726
MGFDDLAASIGHQLAVVGQAPVPFAVCVIIAAVAVWRLMEWRYRAVIDGLEHRIKLRDDSIAHLERKAGKARAEPLPVSTEPQDLPTAVESPLDHIRRWEDPRDRVFVQNRTLPELMDMLVGKTNIQAAAIARPYLGKWIEVSLAVQNVSQSEDETLVMVSHPDHLVRFIWLHFARDRERLEIVEIGDRITAVGRITELERLNARLYSCEMIKAA